MRPAKRPLHPNCSSCTWQGLGRQRSSHCTCVDYVNHLYVLSIEFDADKDEINRFKHGLSLAIGRRVFADLGLQILPSIRPIDGEDRYKAVGMVGGKLYTAVYVLRGERARMISVRRSNASEQRDYDRDPGGSE